MIMGNGVDIMKKQKRYWMLCIILLLMSLIVTGKCLKLLRSEQQIRYILSKEINYDQFRNIKIDKKQIDQIQKLTRDVFVSNNDYQEQSNLDEIGYLTFAMIVSDFDLINGKVPDKNTFIHGIGRVSQTLSFKWLYQYYKMIFSDIKYFPVPYMGKDAETVSYEDSWYAPRTYGGNRNHEGTDLMAANNSPGYFPIISITDGVVEKLGWLEKGGNRIGIRSESGAYFYYAHLDTYAPDLKLGDTVIAGQLLGFMGDSGYEQEGTRGQFDVHLHLGIYIRTDTGEISINPYNILKILEHSRTELLH